MTTRPTKKPPAPKRPKPAGGYIGHAIDRLEELEGRATGDAPHTVHAGYLPYTDYPHLVAAGPTNATAIARFADADEAKAYAALRNASKPLLAVVRAAERVCPETFPPSTSDLDERMKRTKEIAGRWEALRLALATLKEMQL